MRRLILVAKEHKHLLQAAVSGAAMRAGGDIYSAIKQFLTQRNVPHEERQMRPDDVPSHKAFWHS